MDPEVTPMKKSNFRISALLTLSSFATSFASPAAMAGKYGDSACKGVGRTGQYAQKIDERDGNGGKQTFGEKQKENLEKELNGIKDELKGCENEVRLGSQGARLTTDTIALVENRMKKAAKAHKDYNEKAKEVCSEYIKAKEQIDNQTRRAVTGPSKENEYANKMSKISKMAQDEYGKVEKEAKKSEDIADKGLPGNEEKSDPKMDESIKKFRDNLKTQIDYLKKQASKKFHERQKEAAGLSSPEDPQNPVRFKNNAQMKQFYDGLDKCNMAAKKLDQFNKNYQKLSQDVAASKKEAQEASQFFKETGESAGNLSGAMAKQGTDFKSSKGAPDMPGSTTAEGKNNPVPDANKPRVYGQIANKPTQTFPAAQATAPAPQVPRNPYSVPATKPAPAPSPVQSVTYDVVQWGSTPGN